MSAPRLRARGLALAAILLATAPAAFGKGGAPAAPKQPPIPEPPTVVEIPSDELDALLKLQGRAVLVRWAEYRALRDAARARTRAERQLPPEEAVRLSGVGTLDLTDERAARFEIVYHVEGLAPGPRSLGFASGGVAFESVKIEPEPGAGPARYEEREGLGRLHLDGPGVRKVTVVGSAVAQQHGLGRRLDVWLPNPAAMSLAVTLPPGVEATIAGEGPPLVVRSPPEAPLTVRTRPGRDGHLVLAWAQAARGTEGPSVLDADVKSLHTVSAGIASVRALVRALVLRTPAPSLELEVPPDLAVHAIEGPGVTGSTRSENRRRLVVTFEQPVLGAVEFLLQGERPITAGPDVELPRIAVAGALRHTGEVALRFEPDVRARAVRVEGGRRVDLPPAPSPAPPPPPGTAPAPADPLAGGVLRYALARSDATVHVDLDASALRVDATSAYYVNLAEPGQTLLATVTYRVVEGTLFRLRPRFPTGFDLRVLTLNGRPDGFTRDVAADGTVEIALAKGVPAGGEVLLVATLERARADWLPETERVRVALALPTSGATREEGYAAVGADAGFDVLDAGATDLVSVGAADLTARGLSSEGLVYGYRLDGAAPAVALDVLRREPLVEADIVTVLQAGPRRADLATRAIYRITRAGVRRLFLDLPATAGEQVAWQSTAFRAAVRLAGDRRPAGVPEGFERWQVDLDRRVIGTHVVTATWFLSRDADDWSLGAAERIAARAPLERVERLLVVRRTEGLEVVLPALAATPDVRALDLAEVPAEAMPDPRSVLDVLRLPPSRDGVAVTVRKHTGASVLNAIATEVSLQTAVAREGILRTRADLELVNVDRQFVEVALPESSTLIGAVVDGVPVKPLVDPRGVLLVTVPSTMRAARGAGARVHVVLTYRTDLGGPVTGAVRVEGPQFPGLEVLHTTQEVGLEPDLRITTVSGDLLATGPVRRPVRRPWLFTAATVASARMAIERSESGAEMVGYTTGAGPLSRSAPGAAAPMGGAPPAPAPTAAPTTTPPPEPTIKDAEFSDHGETDNDLPEETPIEKAAKPMDAEKGEPGSGKGPGSGATAGRRAGGRGAGRATKALLSLDVPVFLAPNRVVAARVGGGGAVDVAWVSEAASERTYLWIGVVTLAAGLLLVAAGVLPGWLALLGGLLAAWIGHLTLGDAASTAVAAAVDALSILAVFLFVRWILRLPGRRRAPTAPAAASVTTAVLLLLACALLAASPAAAEDAPAPVPETPADAATPADADPAAGPVFVPRDPERGGRLAPDDRVFVPLATWLALQRTAHPERDPEIVALGQVVTLVEAAYGADVLAKSMDGTARLVFARRGVGTLLVPIPLPGLAVTEARLDGQPVRLLLDGTSYLVPLTGEGDHVLELAFHAPLDVGPWGRSFTLGVPTSVISTLDVRTTGFDGELAVSGAGRVLREGSASPGAAFSARAWLGRPVDAGPVQTVTVTLAERRPTSLPAEVRTRVESRVVHSLRDAGTESVLTAKVHVLQGKAPFLDVSVPEGVDVLEATGPEVRRWETTPGRVRLVLEAPKDGVIALRVRAFRAAASPEREEATPELAVLGTTGESGVVVVNGDPTARVEATPGTGLFRTGRPAEPDAAGLDGRGRVLGAWRFAARPAPLAVRVTRSGPRVEVASVARVTFGDDRVQSVLEAVVSVQRAPMGDFAFALPGVDEVRAVEGQGVQAWWLDGTGDARRLLVRMGDLREGTRQLRVRLERRLGGTREAIDVPRMFLTGAQAEKGLLLLFALPDVAPAPTSAAGLRSLPPSRLEGQAAEVPGARATHAYEWDAAHASPLRVALRTPDREVEAVVVTQASPSDEEQRLEHLVVFDVRRGAVDRLRLFVPDGGLAANDVVRARDLRELRSEPAVRKDADGVDVKGLLYTLRLQSMKSGLVEVTVSQLWPAATALRVLRPEDVKATRWFSLVRTFLDGEVDARPGAGAPDEVAWADVPFLPTGLERASVLKSWAARAPFTLEVTARRHRLEAQSEAVVLAAHAEVVVGLDGEARARVRYRLFNRSRQFLRLKLPDGVVLYGASAAGRPVKPLAGVGGTVLLPVPKVPLGGRGYEVVLSYRARAGDDLRAGRRATLPLPTVVDVEVDRTTVTLRLPEPLDYDFDTRMTPASEREALADEVEASLREAQEVLKVAETGTLEQRMFACDNSTPIVAEAARKLADYKAQGARPDRLQGLAMDLDRLTAAQQVAQARCQVDAGEAWSRVQFETKLAQGANANGQTLVVLDEAKTANRPSGGGGGGGGGSEANWRFNFGAAAGEVGKEDLAELKGRLQRGLELRDEVERSKQVDVTAAAEARAKAPPSQQAAEDPATRTYDMSRNSLVLNEELRRVQTDGRQLGTSAAPADDRQSREQSRERRATDYDGESQSESGLAYPDAPAPDGDRRRLPAGEVLLRAGLMGIDVPLPRDGRTFWFVGVRTGSPIALEASEPGTPTWLRTLLAVVLWGALAAGLVRLRRRFAPAAA